MANDDEYNPYATRGQGDGRGAYDSLDEYTRVSAGTPLWGWLSGTGSQVDAARAQDAASQNRSYWDRLQAPTQGQLRDGQGRDAQMAALQQMQQWGRGGLTEADRGMLETQRSRDAQASGSARGAIQQQAQARGLGGSGLDFAGQMAANQQGQQRSSDAESQMLEGAQQRALSAVQAAGGLGTQIRNADTDATQTSFQDAANIAAGATGQYSTDVGSANQRSSRDQQRDQGLISALGAILSS